MKKIIQGLLLAALAVSSSVSAAIVSNRTHMNARSDYGMALDWANQSNKFKGGVGGSLSVSTFWRQSHNSKELAQYYGAGHSDGVVEVQDGTIQVQNNTTAGSTTQALYSYDIEMTPERTWTGTAGQGMGGTLTLAPESRSAGARISYDQCLGFVFDGLSARISTEVVDAYSNLYAEVKGSVASQAAASSTSTTGSGGAGKGVAQYFAGDSLDKEPSGAQDALKNLKIGNRGRNEVGIADITASVRYMMVKDQDSQVALSVHGVIPTGTQVTSQYLFAPLVGTRHWAVGAGLESSFNVYRSENNKHNVDFVLNARYQYGFAGKETRTLGLWDFNKKRLRGAGHYRLLAKAGINPAVPAANVLTQEVNVTPKSSVDGIAGIAYRSGNICFDLGYNLFWKQAETVALADASSWTNDTYARVSNNQDMSKAVVMGKNDSTFGGPIQNENVKVAGSSITLESENAMGTYVTTAACATPSQLTHNIVGGVGYMINAARPVRVGLGGSYEFTTGKVNATANCWSVWAKAGVSF